MMIIASDENYNVIYSFVERQKYLQILKSCLRYLSSQNYAKTCAVYVPIRKESGSLSVRSDTEESVMDGYSD